MPTLALRPPATARVGSPHTSSGLHCSSRFMLLCMHAAVVLSTVSLRRDVCVVCELLPCTFPGTACCPWPQRSSCGRCRRRTPSVTLRLNGILFAAAVPLEAMRRPGSASSTVSASTSDLLLDTAPAASGAWSIPGSNPACRQALKHCLCLLPTQLPGVPPQQASCGPSRAT